MKAFFIQAKKYFELAILFCLAYVVCKGTRGERARESKLKERDADSDGGEEEVVVVVIQEERRWREKERKEKRRNAKY